MTKANLVCQARQTGHVRVFLVRDGTFHDGVEMSAKDCGTVSAKILIEAKRASEMAALKAHAKGASLADVAAIAVSRTDVAPGPLPGELSLILHFGQARLDVRVGLARARELGTALLEAASHVGMAAGVDHVK
jgi:peptidyl-tRNA hydrolase